jgi:uncharacterized membrane protein YcaP (DUF421 family)
VDVVLRAVVIYVVVFAFTRALGRRELSTLQPFDLILLIVIGDLIQSGVTQNDLWLCQPDLAPVFSFDLAPVRAGAGLVVLL